MSQVVDHLAELTGFRDRDVMDVTLVSALRDLLDPQSVAIFRCVGEPGDERWLTRARLDAADVVATADPLWAEVALLPLIQDHPQRVACMQSRNVLQLKDGALWVSLFPIATDREAIGVVEVISTERLKSKYQRTVTSVLRIYHNFQGLLDYSERDTLTGSVVAAVALDAQQLPFPRLVVPLRGQRIRGVDALRERGRRRTCIRAAAS